MNISIFASIGAQNLGDELILKNEIKLLKGEFGEETIFKVASYDPKNPVFQIHSTEYFEYFPLGIKQFKNIFRNIKNFFKFLSVIIWSDIVVIGGGGIIYDSEIQSVGNPLSQWLFRVRISRFFRKKIYFYALGVDIKNPENNKILEKIFKKAWKITVRDEKSQKNLENVGADPRVCADKNTGPDKNASPDKNTGGIEIVDDPVMSENKECNIHTSPSSQFFSLGGEDETANRQKSAALLSSEGEEIQRGGESVTGSILGSHSSRSFKPKDFDNYDFTGKKVGLALRSGYIGSSGDVRVESLLVEEFCQYIEHRGGKIIFLPHSLHPTDSSANDYEFCKQFLNYEREIYTNLAEVYTAYNHQMLDIVISMRLHSIILSYVYGIDQVALSYSQKTEQAIKKLSK